jgi:hypothetical protein
VARAPVAQYQVKSADECSELCAADSNCPLFEMLPLVGRTGYTFICSLFEGGLGETEPRPYPTDSNQACSCFRRTAALNDGLGLGFAINSQC